MRWHDEFGAVDRIAYNQRFLRPQRGECHIIGTALAIALGAAMAGSSVAGAAITSHAAGSAANTQANAANYAADLQKQAADQALAEQQRQFNIGQQNLAPWMTVGRGGLQNLAYLMGIPYTPKTTGTATGQTLAAPEPTQVPLRESPNPRLAGLVPIGQDQFGEAVAPTYNDIHSAGDNGEGSANAIQANAQRQPRALSVPYVSPTGGPTSPLEPPQVPASDAAAPGAAATDPNAPPTGMTADQFGSLMKPWTEQFKAPTVTDDPGYQFRLNEGMKLLEKSAAAKGNLVTGSTAAALERYGQDYASNEYGNAYNRALTEYQQRYNIDQQTQTNQFNRLGMLSGMGQTTAQQLNSAGQNFANSSGTILMNSANAQGLAAQNAAAARASGYVGSANAWSGALSGGTNDLMQLLLLNKLGQGGATSGWI